MVWYDNGVKRYESSGSDDRQFAQRQLRAKLQLAGGRRPTDADPHKVSYSDLRDNFLEHLVANGRRSLKKDKNGKPTLATLPRLDNHFIGWKAREITLPHLKRFRNEAKADGLSDARSNRYMATLRAMFNRAVKDQLITRLECPAYFPTVAEPNEARGAVFIKREWYEPLKRELKEPLRSAFILAYHTAVRVGELERIRWRDIDLENGVITLPASITKTSRSRKVFVPKDFDRKAGAPDDLAFPLGVYRWQWYKACVATGAGRWEDTDTARKRYVGPLLRHCRHTAIRNMSDAGIEEKRIMDISGHVTRSMFDRYNIGKHETSPTSRPPSSAFMDCKQGQQLAVKAVIVVKP